jgi:hypothetical protein
LFQFFFFSFCESGVHNFWKRALSRFSFYCKEFSQSVICFSVFHPCSIRG